MGVIGEKQYLIVSKLPCQGSELIPPGVQKISKDINC
jgi:hypothetical protein